jgi:hypothetical protein
VFFLHQTSLLEKDFLVLQHCISLQVLLVLVSNPGWLDLFLPMLIEGELRLYQLGGGVGLAHLPILVLLVQWRLCSWIVGLVVPLEVQSQCDHTYPLCLPCFSAISNEASCRATMRKSKSSEVRIVCILVMVDLSTSARQ